MDEEFKVILDSLDMTQFEKDLLRLSIITGRFHHVYSMLPKIPEDNPANFSFKSAIREYAIIQLHNFLHIRDSLRNDLEKINKGW